MAQSISAHFDGMVIVPDEPLALQRGQRIRVQIEPLEPTSHPLEQIGNLATDMGVSDLAARHQAYARGLKEANGD